MGRTPKPTAIKIAEGNKGHREIVADEARFVEGAPDMPSRLDAEARKEWRRLIPILLSARGLLTEADGAELALLCEIHSHRLTLTRALDLRKRAQFKAIQDAAVKSKVKLSKAEIEAEALLKASLLKTPSGYQQSHPLVSMINADTAMLLKIYSRFGLDPAARSTLRVGGRNEEEQGAVGRGLLGRGPRLVAV
jgi:P27 family predicted phage terminase small subunit